ncbi:MAG: hypothetical protein KIT06_05580, partial [Cryobacterium sp.]|nr:hypothetical protein [Cryobacterium sp.]
MSDRKTRETKMAESKTSDQIASADEIPDTSDRVPVLKVSDLSVDFGVDGQWVPAAIKLNYEVHKGEVLAIVGESG